jgi:MFS family permease
MAYAINSLAQIGGPLIGGILSEYFGVPSAFLAAAVIYCISIVPLLTAKEIFIPKIYSFKETLKLYRDFPKKFLGYMGFGEELLVLNIWPVYIFIIVEDLQKAGGLATVASLMAAILALIVGKVTDQYSKTILIRLGAFFTAIVWLMRTIATNFWNTFFVDALSRTSKEMAFIPISTVTYIRAEATHVVPYAVFFEQSLAIGKLTACLLGILLFSLTGSFMVLFILGALYSLLYMFV